MTDKQPQTCYVQVDVKSNVRPDFMMTRLPKGDKSFLNGYPLYVTELPNRLIHTHEELEALKAEWQKPFIDKINELMYFVEKDGTPVDGFRFKEIIMELKQMLPQPPKP